jgi:hypothetical protein
MKKFTASFIAFFIASHIISQEKPPICQEDYAFITAGMTIEVPVLENDWCMTGHEMKLFFASSTVGAMVNIVDDLIVYSSFYYFEGIDSVPYAVRDLTNGLISEESYLIVTVDNPGKDFLEVNDIRAMVNAYGYQFCDITEYTPWFEVPKGSGVSSLFSLTLWLGGKDGSGNLHVAAERYRQTGADFFAGPFAGLYGNDYELDWNQLWRLSREEIETHQSSWNDPGYQIPGAIESWPAHGVVASGQATHLAPYIDWNGDEVYQPEWGDLPAIRGDQNLFFIYNDDLAEHTETGGDKLGVEILGQTYGFDCSGDSIFNQTIFLHYDIINRSEQPYYQFYAGIYTDYDLGYAWDDYVGCDTINQAYYVFNGDPDDEVSTIIGGAGYGTSPPAMAVVVLNHPLSACVVPSGFVGPSSLAYTYDEVYNNLQGLWKDSSAIVYGGNGIGAGSSTKLMYTGDPVANTGWTEALGGNPPGDRRVIGVVGPVDLPIGDTLAIDLGLIWARDYTGDHISSLALLQERIPQLRWYYENDSTPCGREWLGVAKEQVIKFSCSVFPNPAVDFINIDVGKEGIYVYRIGDCLGRILQAGKMHSRDQLDISGLAEGIYLLTLSDGTNSITKKFMKR